METIVKKKLTKAKAISLFLATVMFLTVIAPFASPIEKAYAAVFPTVGVDGRVLPASMAGDTSDWVEIARNDGFSLIVRKDVLPIGWQGYSTSGVNCNYAVSNVRNKINTWYNSTLPSNARLRNFAVSNNVMSEIGYFASAGGGISKPTGIICKTGNDIAFALSFGEAASFVSLGYATSSSTWTTSSTLARSNFNKLTKLPSSPPQEDCWWLRSPGFNTTNASAVGTIATNMGNLVWCSTAYTAGYDYVRPALWVGSGIFGPDITYGTVIVKHLDAQSGVVLGAQTLTVPAGNYGYYGPNYYPGYDPGYLAPYSDPPQGVIGTGQIKTIVWLYNKTVVQATINIKHLDAQTGVELGSQTVSVPPGNYGYYGPNTYTGYQPGVLAPYSDAPQGTVAAGQTKNITWLYTKIVVQATINVKHLDAQTGVELGSLTVSVPPGNYGYYGPNTYTGYQAGYLASYSDAPQGTVASGETKNITWLYNKDVVQSGTIIILHVDLATYAVLEMETLIVPAGPYSIPTKFIPGYGPGVPIAGSANLTGVIAPGETIVIIIGYNKATFTVRITHVSDNGTILDMEQYALPLGLYGPYQAKDFGYLGYYPGIWDSTSDAPAGYVSTSGSTINIVFMYERVPIARLFP